eukprot:9494928-Ditylum_brightwellii.AAC.1
MELTFVCNGGGGGGENFFTIIVVVRKGWREGGSEQGGALHRLCFCEISKQRNNVIKHFRSSSLATRTR